MYYYSQNKLTACKEIIVSRVQHLIWLSSLGVCFLLLMEDEFFTINPKVCKLQLQEIALISSIVCGLKKAEL